LDTDWLQLYDIYYYSSKRNASDEFLINYLNKTFGTDKTKERWLEEGISNREYYELLRFYIVYSFILFVVGLIIIIYFGWQYALWNIELTLPAVSFIFIMMPLYFTKKLFASRTLENLKDRPGIQPS